MMYYCPCPCGDPVDPDTEENTFLALPRNLSYVQESYLDSNSVSGRFVFNACVERQIAASTFNHDLRANGKSGGNLWLADDNSGKVEVDTSPEADKNFEGEIGEGAGGHEDEEENVSLLSSSSPCVIKTYQKLPVHFSLDYNKIISACDNSREDNNKKAPNVGVSLSSASASLSASDGDEVSLSSCGVTNTRSSFTESTSDSSSNHKACDERPPSFISRVVSLISPKDDSNNSDKSHCQSSRDSGSSVDAQTPTAPSSSSVLRSPDRSGLIMDRGEDLIVPSHDSSGTLSCAANDNTPTPTDDDFVSSHGPNNCTLGDDGGNPGPIINDTDFSSGVDFENNEANEHVPMPTQSGSDTLSISCQLHLDTNKIYENDIIQKFMPVGSPESDVFSEEGVFVNMLDDTSDVNEKSASEVSDDTNVSVDSMFMSSAEDAGVVDGSTSNNTPPKQMTLEEAISRAASDFNKITRIMYPYSDNQVGENNPSTSKPRANLGKFHKDSLKSLYGLSIQISANEDEDEESDNELSAKESPIYEDDEFNFNKKSLRKSSSLKTNKTPPGTPHRKKVVRFADAMGLDLESVRHVLNTESPPKIPASAMADLKQGLSEDRVGVGSRYLTACFTQPGACDNFVQSVMAKKVRLENAIVTDLTITGFIRVANIDYHKSVRVRYSHNGWATFHDIAASYMQNSCDGPTDRFSFSIVAPAYFVQGNKLEFAVSYNAEGVEFWDNNEGDNYVFECFAKTVPTANESGWIHFL